MYRSAHGRNTADQARAQDKRIGRGPAMTGEQVQEARRLHFEGLAYTAIVRILGKDKKIVKRAVEGLGGYATVSVGTSEREA